MWQEVATKNNTRIIQKSQLLTSQATTLVLAFIATWYDGHCLKKLKSQYSGCEFFLLVWLNQAVQSFVCVGIKGVGSILE